MIQNLLTVNEINQVLVRSNDSTRLDVLNTLSQETRNTLAREGSVEVRAIIARHYLTDLEPFEGEQAGIVLAELYPRLEKAVRDLAIQQFTQVPQNVDPFGAMLHQRAQGHPSHWIESAKRAEQIRDPDFGKTELSVSDMTNPILLRAILETGTLDEHQFEMFLAHAPVEIVAQYVQTHTERLIIAGWDFSNIPGGLGYLKKLAKAAIKDRKALKVKMSELPHIGYLLQAQYADKLGVDFPPLVDPHTRTYYNIGDQEPGAPFKSQKLSVTKFGNTKVELPQGDLLPVSGFRLIRDDVNPATPEP